MKRYGLCSEYYIPDFGTEVLLGRESVKRANTIKHGYVFLPRTIDDSSPERGLWGMVDWKRWDRSINNDGTMFIAEKNNWKVQFMAIPTEAILRALCAQWEAEV